MNRSLRMAVLAALVVAALSSCGRDQATSTQSGTASPSTSAPTSDQKAAPDTSSKAAATTSAGGSTATSGAGGDKVSDFDRNFMTQAAQGGLLEVEASKLALERAESGAVKQFAQMMVSDHTGANEKLRELAQAKGVALPSELNAEGKAKLDKLAGLKGAGFDRAYAEMLGTEEHRKDVSLFEKAAQDAQDADVKAFAAATLPTLREHLSQANKLVKDTVAST